VDTDLVVTLDASRSNCDGASGCNFAIDPLDCSVTGGNGSDVVVVTCPDETPRTFSVDVTDIDSGYVNTATADATPQIVELTGVDTGDIASVNNGDGTCTVSASDVGTAVRARIYWGDRTNTAVNDPATEFIAGITHSCGSTVRIVVYDINYNTAELLF
jgi:hypothetical protein